MNVQVPNESVRAGIGNLFSNYANLAKDDYVIVSFAEDCMQQAAWMLCELKDKQYECAFMCHSHRDNNKFFAELEGLIKQGIRSHRRITVFVCEQEKLCFTKILKQFHQQENINVWRMMNTSADLFEQALISPREDIKKINAWLLQKLRDTSKKQIQVHSELGTELNITLNNDRYSWISSHGTPKKNELITLPTGEINTYPETINGRFVTYGAIHTNVTLPFDSRLESSPVLLEIKNGEVAHFSCDDKYISSFLEKAFQQPYACRVGEFGIGTNIGVHRFVKENSHINERFPGVHLGFGEHLQGKKISYDADIHMDFISPYGVIRIEGDTEEIHLDKLCPVEVEHPEDISSEDVEGNGSALETT